MTKYKYNSWPLGRLKKKHQRLEPSLLKEKGYEWSDPRDIVDICEKKIAKFFGAKYCVTIDCCSHAIFLSLKYCMYNGEIERGSWVGVPRHTYASIPMQVIHAELLVDFTDVKWNGYYYLKPTRVIDSAVMWKANSYISGSLMCLSFQIKKVIPTGKMGAILTDDKEAYDWLKLASYDGRDLTTPYDSKDHIKMIGWHMYATPEDCARTILLMDDINTEGCYMGHKDYPDVNEIKESYE